MSCVAVCILKAISNYIKMPQFMQQHEHAHIYWPNQLLEQQICAPQTSLFANVKRLYCLKLTKT